MGTAYEDIESQFGLKLSPAYRSMTDAGLFAQGGSHYLQLTDFHWLTLDQMLALTAIPARGGKLLPFAESGNGDRWCWNSGWTSLRGVAIAYAARGRKVADGYAENFEAAVYRRLLEEFSSSWLLGTFVHTTEALESLFRRYAQDVAPHLPPAWATTLAEASARRVLEVSEGVYGTLQPAEARAIVDRDLAFAQMGRSIKLRPLG